MDSKKVIIFIAAPGAGKTTQANIIAQDFHLYHFDTSKILQAEFKTMNSDDPELVEAKRLYDSGQLVTPELVARIVIAKIKSLASEENGIVFSSSFRTMYEAEAELSVIEEIYGKDNIHIFSIDITEEESIKRSLVRRVCAEHKHPIPNIEAYKTITECPWDGSALIKKDLDTPDIIKERFQVFLKDTKPVIQYFLDHKYEVVPINGIQDIEGVTRDILQHLKLHPL